MVSNIQTNTQNLSYLNSHESKMQQSGEVKQNSEVEQSRVQEIKEQINQGSYRVDTQELSQRLADELM